MDARFDTGGGLSRARLSAAFDEAAFRREVARSNADPIPRPLAISLHLPDARTTERRRSGYIERLMREIEQVARLFDRDRDALALHYDGGAGVPLALREIEALVGSLDRHFHFGSHTRRAFSIRIDPHTVSESDLTTCATLGFLCADFDADDRDPSAALRTIDAARRAGLKSVCVSQPLGDGALPAALLGARPDRLTCVWPETAEASRSDDGLQRVADGLAAADYVDIGLDARALPWIEPGGAPGIGGVAREGAWRRPESDIDLIGFGAGTVSRIRDAVSQNHPDLETWEAALDVAGLPVWRGLHLDADDRMRLDIIGDLLRTGEIAVDSIERRYAVDFHQYFARELQALQRVAGVFATVHPHCVQVTSQGRLRLRIMAACFDKPGLRPPP